MKKGDKVTPVGTSATSSRGNIIKHGDVLTVKLGGLDKFLVEEARGIFENSDFRIITPSTSSKMRSDNTHAKADAVPKSATRSRKALKKSWEKVLNTTLDWRDSHLCFAGTDTRIPNSPYVPNTEKQEWKNHRRH